MLRTVLRRSRWKIKFQKSATTPPHVLEEEKTFRVSSTAFSPKSQKIVKANFEKRLPPPARFGRYEAETFRVYAEDLPLQRLAGAFFRKIPQC